MLSSTSNSTSPLSANPLSSDDKINLLLVAMEKSNSLLTEMLQKQDALATTVQALSSDFISFQHQFTAVSSVVSSHTEQIKNLEASLAEIKSNVINSSKLSPTPVTPQSATLTTPSTDLIISGLPAEIGTEDHPQFMNKLFSHLKIPHLSQFVVKSRILKRTRIYPAKSSPSSPATVSHSVVVQMVSPQVRDLVIDAKRTAKRVKLSDLTPISEGQHNDDILVNEFLHPNVFRLFQRTREKLARLTYGKAWTKSGVVYAKLNDNSPPKVIVSEADLQDLL